MASGYAVQDRLAKATRGEQLDYRWLCDALPDDFDVRHEAARKHKAAIGHEGSVIGRREPGSAPPTRPQSTAMLAEQSAVPVVAYEWISGLAASSANDAFYDIVLGDNDLFGVGCCTAGPGYDQASGWGSMNLGAVSQALNTSPQYRIAVSSGAN